MVNVERKTCEINWSKCYIIWDGEAWSRIRYPAFNAAGNTLSNTALVLLTSLMLVIYKL
jgi:hypothetical protein